MATKIMIKNEASFTASITDSPLPYKNVRNMILGLSFLQNGTTAPTWQEILGEISEIQIKHKEYIFNGLAFGGEDLLALNLMMLGNVPEFVTPAGDNQAGFIGGLVIPLNYKTTVLPTYSIGFSDNTKLDTEKITVGLELGAGSPAYTYAKKSDTANTVGTTCDISLKGKRLKALMIKATTIPSTSNHNRSVKELKIFVNTIEQYHFNWFELGKGLAPVNAVENTTLGAILDNWRILIFASPIGAENLEVWTKSATATDAIYFIGIYV